jgi:hypothetical protein
MSTGSGSELLLWFHKALSSTALLVRNRFLCLFPANPHLRDHPGDHIETENISWPDNNLSSCEPNSAANQTIAPNFGLRGCERACSFAFGHALLLSSVTAVISIEAWVSFGLAGLSAKPCSLQTAYTVCRKFNHPTVASIQSMPFGTNLRLTVKVANGYK